MKISIAQLHTAFQKAAETIKAASGDDQFISKQDILIKLATLEGYEREVIAAFYEFLKAFESHPKGRTTWSDLERALPYIKDEILPRFHLAPGALTEETRWALTASGLSGIKLAEALKNYAGEIAIPKPEGFAKTLEKLASELEPIGYHCGEYKPFQAVCLPAEVNTLTAENFVQAASKYYIDFNYTVERIVPAKQHFFLGFAERQQPEHQAKARELVNCMKSFLQQISLIILENEQTCWHPTYIVGTLEGNIVGIRTNALWPDNGK